MKNNDKLNIVKIKVIKIKYLIILLIARVIIIMTKKKKIFSLTFIKKPIRSIIFKHNMEFIKFVFFIKKRKYLLLNTYFCFYEIVNGAVILYIIYKLYIYIK